MIYLLDASIFVFRGWFALPDSLRTPDDKPANAFRGFATTLADTLTVSGRHPLIVCFDESLTTSFRNDIDPDYKANRELPPEELELQFRWCNTLTNALGLYGLRSSIHEADDLMASVGRLARASGQAVTVISRDKDLAQMLGPKDHFWEGPGKTVLDYPAMAEKLGFPPERTADFLALSGDPVDNIPGIRGVGAKSASRLMQTFKDLEGLYAGLDRIPEMGLRGAARLRSLLESGRDQAFHARRLTRLCMDAPLPFESVPTANMTPDPDALAALDESVGLGKRTGEKLWGYVNGTHS